MYIIYRLMKTTAFEVFVNSISTKAILSGLL